MTSIVLITGGAGFIGCALSHRLVGQFDKIVAVDLLLQQVHPRQVRPDELHPSVELIVGDVCEDSVWDDILAEIKPDTIIHLAAETGTGQSLTKATRHAQANVVGTTQMLDGLTRSCITPRRMVLSSSRAVYGEGAWESISTGKLVYPGMRTKSALEAGKWDFPGLKGVPFEASKVFTHPTNVYASTKLAQENIMQAWVSAFGCDLYVLRLQNVFGPGQSLYNPYTGIVQIFSQLAREGIEIPVYEDGNIVRDFILVDDVADAISVCAMGQGTPGTYDVGSGKPTTIYDLARLIASHYRAPEPIVTGQYRFGDVRYAACRLDRTTRNLGWKPKHSLEQGLEKLWHWMNEELDEIDHQN